MSLNPTYSLASSICDLYTLTQNLPGHVNCQPKFDLTGDEHVVTIIGRDEVTEEEAYECKIGFSFGKHETRLKNFSIHDPQQRGNGLGSQLISNLVEVTRGHDNLEQISLTAELERGAMVWLKMGWLPDQTSFTKLQKKCLPKLDVLQQLLPSGERPSATSYGIMRDVLDHQSTSDPTYAWVIVDSGASYSLKGLREIQDISRIEDRAQRHEAIAARAAQNAIPLGPEQIAAADKTLQFIKNLDLDGLAREGRVKAAATLLAWESWKGTLRLDNPLQMQRLDLVLKKVNGAGVATLAEEAIMSPVSAAPKELHA